MAEYASLDIKINSAALLQAQQRMREFGSEASRAETEAIRFGSSASSAMNQAGAAAARARVPIHQYFTNFGRETRSRIQNISYQIADFAVQAQMGTSPLVALNQQLPQALGSFGAMGAALGAVSAVVLPFVYILSQLKDQVKDLDEAFEEAENSVGAFYDAVENRVQTISDLAQRMGDFSGAARELVDLEIFLSQNKALRDIESALDSIVEKYEITGEQLDLLAAGQVFDPTKEAFASAAALTELNLKVKELSDELGIGTAETTKFLQAINDFKTADSLDEQREIARRLREELTEAAGEKGVGGVGSALEKALSASVRLEKALGVVNKTTEELSDTSDVVLETFDEFSSAIDQADIGVTKLVSTFSLLPGIIAQAAGEAYRLSNISIPGTLSGDFPLQAQDIVPPSDPSLYGLGTIVPGSPAAKVQLSPFDRTNIVGNTGGKFPVYGVDNGYDVYGTYGFGDPEDTKSGGGGRSGLSEAEKEAERIEKAILRAKENAWKEYYDEMERMRERELDRIEEVNDYVAQSFADMFSNAITGAKSLRESIADLLGELGNLAINNAFRTLFASSGFGNSIFGTAASSIFGIGEIPQYAAGTSYHPGGLALVGEQGPELVKMPGGSQVYPNQPQKTSASEVNININVSGARGNAEIAQMVNTGVRSGLAQMREVFADRVVKVSSDPWLRGV